MTNDNLNNVAGALIGLSELLEEADQVIDEISRVPTVGDILQQAVQGFIMQKMAPRLLKKLNFNTFVKNYTVGMVLRATA